jgi:hypothetical protein
LPDAGGPREIDRIRLCGDSIDESDDGPGSPGVIAADVDLVDRDCCLDIVMDYNVDYTVEA